MLFALIPAVHLTYVGLRCSGDRLLEAGAVFGAVRVVDQLQPWTGALDNGAVRFGIPLLECRRQPELQLRADLHVPRHRLGTSRRVRECVCCVREESATVRVSGWND